MSKFLKLDVAVVNTRKNKVGYKTVYIDYKFVEGFSECDVFEDGADFIHFNSSRKGTMMNVTEDGLIVINMLCDRPRSNELLIPFIGYDREDHNVAILNPVDEILAQLNK
ncbi:MULTISPECIES: hypothetical protein [Rodentibacter]|uniref:Uncharacterized protein n=1 Tax=Rodentibacter pneumotropicus TaxID=758 RepID=A0A4S2PYI2_9PAST|nr:MULTISPECIES: hypothetical protein [Pasteurellaceae]TGY50799.1 hypothetical protein E5343_00135 [Pasteurella caecimuris]TGZ98142.1 hypothetical protein D3M79_10425 [Rodentibacter pneumotropicus]THA00974.1 hypothetical protein D3M74_06505 [Rodentibacter pneumotropicus]THA08166.1 hypothetical protein D3M78_08105 [Rodentibacter pneumotropicus]THA09143.1 hypothetical protein D3M77_02890 [Rodentibacter pneumotropicus]